MAKRELSEEQKEKMKVGREKAIKEKKENNNSENKSSDEKLDALISTVNVIAGAVGKLVELQTRETKIPDSHPENGVKTAFTPQIDDETYPKQYIPKDFRKAVDDILSTEFGIIIEDFPDRSDFLFSVIVPDQYSSISPADRDKGIKDIRSRMIPRALGVNGVKEWCSLIRTNLNRFYTKEGVQSPFTSMA